MHATPTLPPSEPPASDPPHLADMLMYRLYQAWSQSNPVFVRMCEGRFGITRREWRILACAVEGGIMNSAELAATAKLDLARTSRTLGTLCEKGWLRRLHDSADRRVVRVEATAEGIARYQALLPEVSRLNDLLVQDLSGSEIALLRDFLVRIEQRGRRMAEDNIVSEKASRREGGTRRARYA
ncbi:MarR family winged helix-turn-helix transcriptional regulator [Achromobacter sp. UMC46]|uniref:MarR family winged helix-turn-helix transcriptional regulator n=1 Tax=Achromobacter sp. UMC46 TaxID=1862319 RepID=UPI0021064124|nr:MarR family transcriptional regulator [Achromobacter sp. UMC46]MBB1593679.1 DNA-binding protein [Achromobacter sp. UMC46]